MEMTPTRHSFNFGKKRSWRLVLGHRQTQHDRLFYTTSICYRCRCKVCLLVWQGLGLFIAHWVVLSCCRSWRLPLHDVYLGRPTYSRSCMICSFIMSQGLELPVRSAWSTAVTVAHTFGIWICCMQESSHSRGAALFSDLLTWAQYLIRGVTATKVVGATRPAFLCTCPGVSILVTLSYWPGALHVRSSTDWDHSQIHEQTLTTAAEELQMV